MDYNRISNPTNWKTEFVESMQFMFYRSEFENLDLSNFDTSKVTKMNQMFYKCTALTNLDLSNFDTSKVTNMTLMFNSCSSLTNLDLSNFDMSSVVNINDMFGLCSNLTELNSFRNFGKGFTTETINWWQHKLNLSSCTNLTHDSLMSVINNLYDLNLTYDVANGGTLYTQSLTLGSTNLAKLTAEEIAIATNKGWTVS